MITPAYGLTATERVLPSMALDFTTASLDSRVTFTRTGNTATVTNSSGYVVGINADLPRFDFDPIALTCKGLLIEEARTNLCLYSEAFDTAASWVVGNASVTANATTAPSNTLTADKLVEDVAASEHSVLQTIAYVTNNAVTLSVYAKTSGRNLRILMSDNLTGVTFALYNLTNGTFSGSTVSGSWSAISSSITNVGNGWYRCTLTATKGAGAVIAAIINLTDGTNTAYTGDGVSGAFLWGAQLETGAFPTSYIPTVASQVTRTDDVAVMTSTNFSSWYTATTGAAVVWAIPQTATGTRPLIQFDDTTANEIIALRGNVADPELYIVDGGVAQAQIDAGTIVANTAYKLSGAWDTNTCAAAKDGAAVVTDNTATIPTPTQLRIGSDGTNYASAVIQKIMYWKQRIINAEVQAFSKYVKNDNSTRQYLKVSKRYWRT